MTPSTARKKPGGTRSYWQHKQPTDPLLSIAFARVIASASEAIQNPLDCFAFGSQ